MARDLGIVDALAQLSFVVQSRIEQRAAEHELSVVQSRLLGILRDREPTMNELAGYLSLDKSSVSGLVHRAADRGLVERVPSTTDRRVATVRLTPGGRELVNAAAAAVAADLAAMVRPLSRTDRGQLSRLVTAVLVAHAADQGVELFATVSSRPGP